MTNHPYSTTTGTLRGLLIVRKVLRWLLGIVLSIMTLGALCVILAEAWTWLGSVSDCHDTPQECESNNAVGLVLGCSKYLAKGQLNYYYEGRMQAAADLWKSGKVRCIIVSGDNRVKNYNEPATMRKSLIEMGVPADKIVQDYAGLCTYDSVYRAKHIFNADKLIIVSQPDHVSRAVAIADYLDIEAEGLNAPLRDISTGAASRAWIRERGARVKMVYDLLFSDGPTHLGEPISLPE